MNPAHREGNMRGAPSAAVFDWNEIYHSLCEQIWLILGMLALFAMGGILFLALATPSYEAVATVEVEQRQHPVVNIVNDQPEDYRSLDFLNTVEGNLNRPTLLLSVLARPEIKNNIYLSKLAANPTAPENKKLFQNLQKSITAKLRRASRLIDITVEHRDPETAQLLANLVVDEYIHESFHNESATFQNTSEYLTGEAQRMKDKLQNTELQLQKYGKLVDLRQRVQMERKELDLLNERYLEKHPKIIQAHALLDDLQKQFIDEMRNREASDPAPANSQATPQVDMSAMTPQQAFEHEMAVEEGRYNVLVQEDETERTLYESILDRLKEAGISQGFQDVNITLAEPASLPTQPAKPRPLLVMAIALFVGTAAGLSTALGLNSLDSSFRTVDDVERRLNIAVLGAIPEVLGKAKKRKKKKVKKKKDKDEVVPPEEPSADRLIVSYASSSLAAEAIRTLRASLKLLGRKEEKKTFLFTSAIPSEGKSFIAANVAASLALEGSRVLLIDADLRKPVIHEMFDCSRTNLGLGEWLVCDKRLSELALQSSIPNLYLLPAGGFAPNPAEILSKGGFHELLSEASLQYDYIICDSAPIHAVGDTLLICEYFQTTCLVIHAGRTPAPASARALRLLTDSGAKIGGCVLNRLPVRTGFRQSNPYYYYYQSAGKYGEAYGAKR